MIKVHKKVKTTSLRNNYTNLSHIRAIISSRILDFFGLCSSARIPSRDRPKVAFNLVGLLVLNSEKHFSHIIIVFELHTVIFNTTITYITKIG